MVRVLVLVEGQTEKKFVKEILAPTLAPRQVFLTARLTGKPGRKGGVREYNQIKKEIVAFLRQDKPAYCATMFDYYGLPKTWPGKSEADDSPFHQMPQTIEAAIHEDIALAMGKLFQNKRLIPYIQMHEFEALLFSQPDVLAETLQQPGLAESLHRIAENAGSPEAIDNDPATAPSKRILRLCPGYQKVVHGNIAAQRIGLAIMRTKCPHFDKWIAKLESLS